MQLKKRTITIMGKLLFLHAFQIVRILTYTDLAFLQISSNQLGQGPITRQFKH